MHHREGRSVSQCQEKRAKSIVSVQLTPSLHAGSVICGVRRFNEPQKVLFFSFRPGIIRGMSEKIIFRPESGERERVGI